ncbi:MAG: PilZ domain-containing protein [Polyangiaceae bacterium]
MATGAGFAPQAAPPPYPQHGPPAYPQHASPATQPSQAMAYQPRPEPVPQVAYAQPPVQQAPPAYPQPVAPPQYAQPAAQPAYPQAPAAAPPQYAQPAAQPAYPQAPAAAAPPVYAQQPTAERAPAPPPPAGSLRVEAELGAHSSTNFYKGLSGNDVIDSGGIFVATYQIPEIGQTLSLRVSMPGGYEFEAIGIVRWTRDAPNSGADGAPGFGAQFTQITPEGRQLVYRYVRNREPLFHDDL